MNPGAKRSGRVRGRIERLGAAVLDGYGAGRELAATSLATLRGVLRGQPPPGEVAQQMYIIGNKSLLFVAVTLGFIGMVMVYQSCLQLNRITGDLSQVGPEFLKLLIQEFGPSITALMLATRVGAGIAAEIGSMKVTEQVDALRMSGVTPIDYLITPRFIASVVMTAVLTVFAILIAYGAGGLTAATSFGVNPETFFDPSRVRVFDIALGATKTLCYGMAIPIISGFCGLRARGSSEGVGSATTLAVIGSSLAVILVNFVISGAGLMILGSGR
jgi:phospholipid/cholesterol/gamma-HCH transport system permease protein